MARPREFDQQAALDSAMELFWSRGYQAASMTDLMAAMGLSKSSFYESFGNKRDVLLEAIRRYGESSISAVVEPLKRPDAGRQEIENLLHQMAAHAASPAGQRGCLVNNCLAEVAPHDPEVLEASLSVRSQLQDALVLAIGRGQQAGTITTRESPDVLARFLINTLSGINLAAKSRPPQEVLDGIVRVALHALD